MEDFISILKVEEAGFADRLDVVGRIRERTLRVISRFLAQTTRIMLLLSV